MTNQNPTIEDEQKYKQLKAELEAAEKYINDLTKDLAKAQAENKNCNCCDERSI